MLAAYDPSIAQRLAFATGRSVLDAWRLYPCERGEMHTYVCGSGSDVAAVRSAVDREAEDASREQKLRGNGDLHVCAV